MYVFVVWHARTRCMHIYISTYTHTYIHTDCISTYSHTYTHTHIHTHTHTHIHACRFCSLGPGPEVPECDGCVACTNKLCLSPVIHFTQLLRKDKSAEAILSDIGNYNCSAVSVRVSTFVCLCMYVCMYACMHACMYMYTCEHMHTFLMILAG